MTVYALIGTWFYEGDTVIALYATRDAAEAAKKREVEGAIHPYDQYRIDAMEVQS